MLKIISLYLSSEKLSNLHDTFKIYGSDSSLKDYKIGLSDEAAYILEFIRKQFPLLAFIIWETRAYNEFANHPMARNLIFIEVENPLDENVSNALHEQNGMQLCINQALRK